MAPKISFLVSFLVRCIFLGAKFMRLILYIILDVFIQGGGAGTGLLWAAQVKFK